MRPLKKSPIVLYWLLALTSLVTASTASQREFKRGYTDCSAGRWDQNQHGVSYKEGCAAAEAKRNAGDSAQVGAPPAGGTSPDRTAPTPGQKIDTFMDPSVSGKDKQACMRAVRKQTNNTKVAVIGALSSEANNQVTVAVGRQRAPWKCLVKRGKVSSVMSLTDEGAL